MSTTITIRADDRLRAALERRASAQGKTISEVVREILEGAIVERPVQDRVGHLAGRLRLDRKSHDALRQRLRSRNWRP